MRVIPPIALTDAKLTSTTAPEPAVGEQAYNAGTTYGLGDQVILGAPSATVTITNASPAVVTWTGHGQPDGTAVTLSTTGTLPTGLLAATIYYVVSGTANTFRLSASVGGAPLSTTAAGSGVHTATTSIHRVFQSLQAGNVGRYPLLTASATWWLDIGPTNRWAMFDLLRNTPTQVASPLTVTIAPGERVDAIGLIGLIADSAIVTVTIGASVAYTKTLSLKTRATVGWYSYFFSPFKTITAFELIDLPPYSGATITVTLTRVTGQVSCGGLILGRSVYLGQTQYNAVDDALNFSIIERDAYGNTQLVPRRSVPKTMQKVWCDKGRLAEIRAVREALNAVPALWTGIDDSTDAWFESLLILGIYKQFSINLGMPTTAELTLELEEV